MLLRYLTVKLKIFLGSLLWADDQREFTVSKSDSGGK